MLLSPTASNVLLQVADCKEELVKDELRLLPSEALLFAHAVKKVAANRPESEKGTCKEKARTVQATVSLVHV